MTRKLEAVTPGYERVFVVVSPTFGIADRIFRAAEALGLNVHLTAGDYCQAEITRIYHTSKGHSYVVVYLDSPLHEWDYDSSEEYQLVHLPEGKSATDTVLDMFHRMFDGTQATEDQGYGA